MELIKSLGFTASSANIVAINNYCLPRRFFQTCLLNVPAGKCYLSARGSTYSLMLLIMFRWRS